MVEAGYTCHAAAFEERTSCWSNALFFVSKKTLGENGSRLLCTCYCCVPCKYGTVFGFLIAPCDTYNSSLVFGMQYLDINDVVVFVSKTALSLRLSRYDDFEASCYER